MNRKSVLLGFLILFSVVYVQGQTTDHSNRANSDIPKNLAFEKLVSYISADTFNLQLQEAENNSISHVGEEHTLVVPTNRGSGHEENGSVSWNKWLPTVYNKEATVGSPFLLFLYVPGLVVSNSYMVLNTPNVLFNYDKMSGNLIAKKNKELPIAVNKESVQSFCLKTDKGGFIFMRVPSIDDNEFFQVLYKGPKYSSYKLYKSKFVQANQTTNGYITEGKDYDEYEDLVTYYLLDEKNEISYIFELRKKSIKQVFGSLNSITEKYFKDHRYEDVTESLVANLTAEFNK
jgi:hypothetical protein